MKWKAIKHLTILIAAIKIENEIINIMQLDFTLTAIQERFLFMSWRRKQNFQEINYALLTFDTLSFSSGNRL